MSTRRMGALLVGMVCTLLPFLMAVPTTANADDVHPLVRSLVLGDSYSSGVGGGGYQPGPCAVSSYSYAVQWALLARVRGINAAWPDNHACFGATTQALNKVQPGVEKRQLD